MRLAELLESYFRAADAHDTDAALAHFTTDARVRDEGEDHQGTDAIRTWMEKTNAAYNTRYDVQEISVNGDTARVSAAVSGTFPGSPLTLNSRFVVRDGKIIELECGA